MSSISLESLTFREQLFLYNRCVSIHGYFTRTISVLSLTEIYSTRYSQPGKPQISHQFWDPRECDRIYLNLRITEACLRGLLKDYTRL